MKTCVAAKCIIQHPDEPKVMFIKRKIQNEWFFEPVGGRVEVNFSDQKAETLEECVQRESLEETGIGIQFLQYVGSYYFFWLQHPNTCSICALFFATFNGVLGSHKTVVQEQCGATYPVWVSIQDLSARMIRFNPRHVGLERLICQAFSNPLGTGVPPEKFSQRFIAKNAI